jgi:hypothetical protein
MSKLEDWASKQLAGMREGAAQIGSDIVSDVGATYQAFLMHDAGYRVPRAHGDFSTQIAQEAETAEIDEAVASQTPEPDATIEPE